MNGPHKVCPGCGLTRPLDDQICPGCGHQFSTQFAQPLGQTTAFQPIPPIGATFAAIGRPKPKLDTMGMVLVGVCALVGILMFLSFIFQRPVADYSGDGWGIDSDVPRHTFSTTYAESKIQLGWSMPDCVNVLGMPNAYNIGDRVNFSRFSRTWDCSDGCLLVLFDDGRVTATAVTKGKHVTPD